MTLVKDIWDCVMDLKLLWTLKQRDPKALAEAFKGGPGSR